MDVNRGRNKKNKYRERSPSSLTGELEILRLRSPLSGGRAACDSLMKNSPEGELETAGQRLRRRGGRQCGAARPGRAWSQPPLPAAPRSPPREAAHQSVVCLLPSLHAFLLGRHTEQGTSLLMAGSWAMRDSRTTGRLRGATSKSSGAWSISGHRRQRKKQPAVTCRSGGPAARRTGGTGGRARLRQGKPGLWRI